VSQGEQTDTNATCSSRYLALLGVPDLAPLTSPFDPGYDPTTVDSHLGQSAHLMSTLKISMASWIVARESATRQKVAAARAHHVVTVTGGGPFEIAVAQNVLEEYLDLCADMGFDRIECGEGFTDLTLSPAEIVEAARARGLEVQFELGKKHGGSFNSSVVDELMEQGNTWLAAGASELIIEARESAAGVGLFEISGELNEDFADRFVEEFGFDLVAFEAPNKASQFALLEHFGREVRLCNVRLEELLRVEIFRRGLHSDAFLRDNLRPKRSQPANQ
jgi:phosphosulfolactate synthase